MSGNGPVKAAVRGTMRVAIGATPLKSGLATISQGRVAQWACRDAGVVEARLRGGLRIEADAGDYNGRMLVICGTADPKIVGVCSTLLRVGDVFLDVGANYGTIGLMCARVVGRSGDVHLYEPQSALCDRIERCASESGLSWCHVHRYGLFDRDDCLTMHVSGAHSGAASFVRGDGCDGPILEVREAAGEIARATGGRPFGAKLDVEGAEPRVLPALMGARGFRFVVFECTDDTVRVAAWELSQRHGLRLFGLCREAFRLRIEAIGNAHGLKNHHDILAVKARGSSSERWRGHPRELERLLA